MEETLPAIIEQNGSLVEYKKPPQEIIEEATEKAKCLKEIVKQAGLSIKLGSNKEYLEFEAWQTIGNFYGCSPFVEWTREILKDGVFFGWEARAVVKNILGNIVASAEHQCTREENNWSKRDGYALRSMAQTRAMGKALRSKFAWVVVLAGYSPTPVEEMDGLHKSQGKRQPSNKGKKKEEKEEGFTGDSFKDKGTCDVMVDGPNGKEPLNPSAYGKSFPVQMCLSGCSKRTECQRAIELAERYKNS